MIFPSSLPTKPLAILRMINAFQGFNFYSIRGTSSIQKSHQFSKPGAQKSSEISPILYQGIKKHSEVITVWPRPREVPYQAKVANLVNLIGRVQTPVKFEASSNGKHFAATVIYGGEKNSLLIPVVFEGDLAHIMAYHVKENDFVSVSGKLSNDPMRLMLNQYLGTFYVLAENFNFVEGLEVNFLDKRKGALLNIESEERGAVLGRNDAVIIDKDWLKTGKSKRKSVRRARKKKDGNLQLDLWRDVVKNPLQWWDYRDHKSNGLVKENFPDFKQKGTEKGLWLSSAPEWVFPGLAKLELDVKVMGRRPGEMERPSKLDNSWKNLVENPGKWSDNRANKKNPKGPDFKHKETGEALWLSSSPAWVLPGLLPSRDVQRLTTNP